MHVELPDPNPGRCRNLRYYGPEAARCLDYDDTPHICRFTVPHSPPTTASYTIQTTSASPWVAPTDKEDIDNRDPGCVLNWPDCIDGDYNPACCRFPKSCSCESW